MPDIDVHIWRTQNASSSDVSSAIDSLNHLNTYLDHDINTYNRGEVELYAAPYDNYGDYLANFSYECNFTEGTISMLIYSQSIWDGWLCCEDDSNYPYMGYAVGGYHHNTTPYCVVNRNSQSVSSRLYDNMVKHEMLHHLDVDHDDGDQAVGDYCYNTPMMSAYAESVSNNFEPNGCNDDNQTCNNYTYQPTDCTQGQASYWMEWRYYDN